MRIIAGQYGRRSIKAPKTAATRPMTDKVRAALFDMIGDIGGKSVLDAYAGSGAVGIEALSRGATRAVLVESAKPAIRTIQDNLQQLGIDGAVVQAVTIEKWLKQNPADHFDLVVADPPYAEGHSDVLSKLASHLKPGGALILSHSSKADSPIISGLNLKKAVTHGDSKLSVYL